MQRKLSAFKGQNMFGKLYEHLSSEEIEKLNGKYFNLDVEEAMDYYYGENGHHLAELCGDNMEDAEILIHGIYRGLDGNDYDEEYPFIYSGGQKNLAIRKYFSSRKVKALRAQTDLSQEKFAKKVGLKRRTYQNYEEGQRIPSRLILNAMQSVTNGQIWCIRDHRRLTLNLNLLSETTIQFLEIALKRLYHFYWYIPYTRRVSAGEGTIRMYWVKAEDKWEESFEHKYMTTDYFPEDLAACIKCAQEYNCDEILFEDRDHSIHGDSTSKEQYYINIASRIETIKADLEKEKNKYREHTYQLIKDYLADEASGDPYKMLKWTDGLKEAEIEERRIKDKVEASFPTRKKEKFNRVK